jgi:hypothetical protein
MFRCMVLFCRCSSSENCYGKPLKAVSRRTIALQDGVVVEYFPYVCKYIYIYIYIYISMSYCEDVVLHGVFIFKQKSERCIFTHAADSYRLKIQIVCMNLRSARAANRFDLL